MKKVATADEMQNRQITDSKISAELSILRQMRQKIEQQQTTKNLNAATNVTGARGSFNTLVASKNNFYFLGILEDLK